VCDNSECNHDDGDCGGDGGPSTECLACRAGCQARHHEYCLAAGFHPLVSADGSAWQGCGGCVTTACYGTGGTGGMGDTYPAGTCGHHQWGEDGAGAGKCGDRAPYPEGDARLHETYADDAESCCMGDEVMIGLGRIAALQNRSSALSQIFTANFHSIFTAFSL
jgi:hypothetical protein